MAKNTMSERETQERLAEIRRLARPGSGEGATIRLKKIAGVAGGEGEFGKPSTLAKRLSEGQASRSVRTSERNRRKASKKERSVKETRDRMLTTGHDRGSA